jgi:hypothetical protein
MKRTKIFLLAATAVFVLGCSSPQLATIKTQAEKPEVIITTEMKQFLAAHKNLSVVLRVPNSSDKVTAEENSKNLDIYNRIEKNLMKAGFNVRDRGLLENLLRKNQNNYVEIAKTIQTDIIIEVVDITWGIDDYQRLITLKKNNEIVPVIFSGHVDYGWYGFNPMKTKCECKFTIIENGSNGGVLSYTYSPCTEGCDFEVNMNYQLGVKSRFSSAENWERPLIWGSSKDVSFREKFTDSWSEEIIKVLKSM